MEEDNKLPGEANAIKELSKRYGIHEAIAEDCLASRTDDEMKTILKFLERYGHMIRIK